MNWVAIVLMIIRILRELQDSEDLEAFAETNGAKAIGDGEIIKWLWEHREEIVEFVIRILDLFDKEPVFGNPAIAEAVAELEEH